MQTQRLSTEQAAVIEQAIRRGELQGTQPVLFCDQARPDPAFTSACEERGVWVIHYQPARPAKGDRQ